VEGSGSGLFKDKSFIPAFPTRSATQDSRSPDKDLNPKQKCKPLHRAVQCGLP